VNDTVRIYSVADNGLQCLSGTIGNDLCINITPTLKDAKYRGFTISAAATFSFNALGPEVQLVYFDLSGKLNKMRKMVKYA
jgi:hypothetical protein